MMHMGNGERSAARCYEHLATLLELHQKLSGAQQIGLGPNPYPVADQMSVWATYTEDVEDFIRTLQKDLLPDV